MPAHNMVSHKKSTHTIKIDKNRCKGCELCIEVCVKNCFKIADSMNTLGYYPVEVVPESLCTGCGMCYQICPDICIEIHKHVNNAP